MVANTVEKDEEYLCRDTEQDSSGEILLWVAKITEITIAVQGTIMLS